MKFDKVKFGNEVQMGFPDIFLFFILFISTDELSAVTALR